MDPKGSSQHSIGQDTRNTANRTANHEQFQGRSIKIINTNAV